MKRLVLFFLIVSAGGVPATADDTKAKAQIEVVEMTAKRQEGLILLDGRVRNSGERSLNGLKVIFRFQADANTIVTTQRQKIDEATLAPGEESELTAQMKDASRAVEVQILAADGSGVEIPVRHAGPFPID